MRLILNNAEREDRLTRKYDVDFVPLKVSVAIRWRCSISKLGQGRLLSQNMGFQLKNVRQKFRHRCHARHPEVISGAKRSDI